jgi:hypothetical protein
VLASAMNEHNSISPVFHFLLNFWLKKIRFMRIWNGDTLLTGNIRAKNDTTFCFCFYRSLLCRGTEFSESESCLLRNQNKDMSAENGCCKGGAGAGA